MNAPVLSRRALLGATAAIGAMSLPAVAEAGIPASGSDAELFDLLDRFDAARAAWDATDAPLDEAGQRARAAYPPRPDALQYAWSDIHHDLGPTSAHEPLPNGRFRGLYTDSDVERLRGMPPVTRWAWVADDHPEPHPREPDPEGEARRQEIIQAHDAWIAARVAVDEATGFMAAALAAMATGEAFDAAHDAVRDCRPRTVVGLARKAAWVADRLSASGEVELAVAFALEVATFGGAAA